MARTRTSIPVPHPNDWIRLLSRVLEAREIRGDNRVPLPPMPFAMRGYGPTTCRQLRGQWGALMAWIRKHDFECHLGECLQTTLDYDVAEHFAKLFRPYKGKSEDSRPKPHRLLVERAERFLERNWPKIVGMEFAAITRPWKFEGVKKRRLIIAVDPDHLPWWGSWDTDPQGGRRHASTQRLINRALWPMKICVLTLSPAKWPHSAEINACVGRLVEIGRPDEDGRGFENQRS